MTTLLREHRRLHSLSADALARDLEVHPTSLLRWERRERLPGPDHVKALARALELETTTVAQFFDEARPSPAPAAGVRGHGLRALRVQAGVPVRELSARLDVLPATVYNWESGRARIPATMLPALAATIGTDASRLGQELRTAPVARSRASSSELRRLRRRTGLSQAAVAARVGTTRHRLGTWERGTLPPLWAVRRMAAVYGVPVARVARAAGVTAPPLLDPRTWSPGDLPGALVALRGWSGLTQRELAERCGWHPTSVRAWERGRVVPVARARSRLEQLYGLAQGALLAAYPDVSP